MYNIPLIIIKEKILKEFFLGIDIGGTNIKSGVIDKNGKIIKEQINKTEKDSIEIFYNNINNIISHYKDRYNIKKIGIGFPALIDYKRGMILKAPNLKILDNSEYKYITDKNHKIYIDNDANFAAYGEYSILDKTLRDKINTMLFITLGSGLGTGIIIKGDIYHGAKNFIEGGHIIINPEGNDCACGSYGCIESEVSSTGIKRYYKKIAGIDVSDPIEIYKKGEKGEASALKTFDNFAYYLGIGLASYNNLLNPNMIIIGGGLSNFSNLFIDKSKKILSERSYIYEYYKPDIRLSKLMNKAGFYGAACYARDKND